MQQLVMLLRHGVIGDLPQIIFNDLRKCISAMAFGSSSAMAES